MSIRVTLPVTTPAGGIRRRAFIECHGLEGIAPSPKGSDATMVDMMKYLYTKKGQRRL
jgi:hypothetical protein